MHQSPRKIIHIDMDAFYAAVEQRDNPAYRNKPVVVGGKPDSRGVVATCSYEARLFGVHSAMPSARAARLCPQAIFIKPRFDVYREASENIRAIFSRYCDCIEPLSLDEAYLDVSDSSYFKGSATLLAKHIKREIYRQTGLIASAGISYNKFLAKLASDLDKPDGLRVITPEQALAVMAKLPIGKFHGVGPATEKRMRDLGIQNGWDLKQVSLPMLQQYFGKSARHYYDIARGIDHRPVNAHRDRKSIGVETTFAEDIDDAQIILFHLQTLLSQALNKLAEKRLLAYTLTIKVKYRDFVQVTRGRTLPQAIADTNDNVPLLIDLLRNTAVGEKKVRLLGVNLSTLQPCRYVDECRQLDLFSSLL
ncbi:DNA polymerase IV [Methylomonas sp. SURF-2]|uniref:DNA polymerase IV n=1 Tax=Methylomonas subterranea TaxID=2952225 RepID=A0ABT1TFR0_9GAMM|nr:DNA polymerase IV [Methylomonas sp. SURF-2]MCQ8104301.1 DNA polymerase IV [Methylomonas sp. SURF-2]